MVETNRELKKKLDALQTRKDNWIRQRNVETERKEAEREIKIERSFYGSDDRNNSNSNGNNSTRNIDHHYHHRGGSSSSSSSRNSNNNNNNNNNDNLYTDSRLLDKVTEKLSERIEKQVLLKLSRGGNGNGDQNFNSMDKKNIVDKMETFMSDELHNYVCQICFEVMLPPKRSPMLLFPCGHTFCKCCLDIHLEGRKSGRSCSSRKQCPYCRKSITSHAENHCLKQLIERFMEQKNKLENGDITHMDDLFYNKLKIQKEKERENEILEIQNDKDKMKMGKKFLSEYRSISMRHDILKNELDDSIVLVKELNEKNKGIELTRQVLENEKLTTEKKLKEIHSQLELICNHIKQQDDKQDHIKGEEREMNDKIALLQDTIKNLSFDMEKYKVLSSELLPDITIDE